LYVASVQPTAIIAIPTDVAQEACCIDDDVNEAVPPSVSETVVGSIVEERTVGVPVGMLPDGMSLGTTVRMVEGSTVRRVGGTLGRIFEGAAVGIVKGISPGTPEGTGLAFEGSRVGLLGGTSTGTFEGIPFGAFEGISPSVTEVSLLGGIVSGRAGLDGLLVGSPVGIESSGGGWVVQGTQLGIAQVHAISAHTHIASTSCGTQAVPFQMSHVLPFRGHSEPSGSQAIFIALEGSPSAGHASIFVGASHGAHPGTAHNHASPSQKHLAVIFCISHASPFHTSH